jgi:hypothetical protein
MYYYGLLHIVGIKSIHDLDGYMSSQYLKDYEEDEDDEEDFI